jgi:hypothetical protein
MNKTCLLLFLVAFAVILSGCGDGRPARVPVSGRVLIDGKPLERGSIKFIPQIGRASAGNINKDGRFSLGCFAKNDGAVIGRHAIEIFAVEPIGSNKEQHYVPEKYGNSATSGLTQEIKGPTNDLTVELTWAGGKPFVKKVHSGE